MLLFRGSWDGERQDQGSPDWEPKLYSADPAAQTPPVAQMLDNHSPGTDPDNVLLITLFPKVSPFPVKIKTRSVVKTSSAPNGAATLVLGALHAFLDSPSTCQWQGGSPCRSLPALTPSDATVSVSLQWWAPRVHPSGGHDTILLALDLEELSHAGEVLLVGLGHLLLSCLWVHNLQALERGKGHTGGSP